MRLEAGCAQRTLTWGLLWSFLVTLPGSPPALAGVEGAQVREGSATIEVDGLNTTINTQTRETIIDYSKFGVGVDEKMRINQPDAGSKILNRVTGGHEGSRIDGELWSNGTVYILNPSGVFVGDRAIIDVGGLVAGAGMLSNDDFLSGVDRFTEVQGDVAIAPGASVRAARDVVLVGRHVENLGSILAEAGMIAIVAGENVILAPMNGHISVHVDGPGDSPAEPASYGVTQGGTLQAERVTLAAGDMYSLAMNHTGVTRAAEIQVNAGDDGLVQLAGTLDASNAAAGQQGGHIEVRAGKIAVLDATLDASGAAGGGEILVGGVVRGSGGQTARRLFVGPTAKLRANATEQGHGGKIVMYSRERTAFQGDVSAQGGAQGGDGGFVEISGAQLESRGTIDVAAPKGDVGTLLYDPDEIEIIGGSADGNDDPDVNAGILQGSSLGQVLSGDTGTETGDAPFQIYESEIEGSNANIILEAVNKIFASGNFTNSAQGEGVGVVALVPGDGTVKGSSLTMRTTGSTAPAGATDADLGIDLVHSANGQALTWKVSNGGQISLATNLNLPATETPGAPKASIQVGALAADGFNYVVAPDSVEGDLLVPDLTEFTGTPTDAISIATQRGDITVSSLSANGDDSEDGRTASRGRSIRLETKQGDIAVDSITAIGGSATSEQHTRGELGGIVVITAAGDATVGPGGVDVSGGDGIAGAQFGDFNLLDGGGGGVFVASARGTGADLKVKGNITAVGGNGEGSFVPEVDGEAGTVTVEADGGSGGSVSLEADGDLTVLADSGDPQVEINTSGGDGTGSGGDAVSGSTSGAIAIVHGPDADTAGDLTVNARLVSNGGDAHQGAATVGGRGGSGGNITVSSNGGKLNAQNMEIEANGGNGNVGVDADGTPLADDQGFLVGSRGGTTGSISVGGTKEVIVGNITAQGGDSINGSAGGGATLTIDSTDSTVTLAGEIDVDGGNASSNGAKDVTLAGGEAGSIVVRAPGTVEDEGEEEGEGEPVGDVFLANVVGGTGGSGVVVDGTGAVTETTRAQSASIDVEASRNLEMGAPGGRFEGGNVALTAGNIGASAAGPVAIAGTGQETDVAVLVTGGTLRADVDPNASRSLDRVDMILTDPTGHAELTRGGAALAASTAATETTLHTLTQLGRGNDSDPTLGYRLDVPIVENVTQPVLSIAQGAINLGKAGGAVVNGGFATTDVPIAENRGAIVGAAGGGVHATTTGDLRLEGGTLGVGVPLLLDGDRNGDRDGDGDPDGGAALILDAKGDVFVNVVDGGAFGAIDIAQNSATGNVTMDLSGSDQVKVIAGGTTAAPVHTLEADTTASQSAFGYIVDTGAASVQLVAQSVRLGGRGSLVSTGDLVLADGPGAQEAITTGGHDLTLVSFDGAIKQDSTSEASIDLSGPGTPDEEDTTPARLAFFAGTAVGSATNPIRTEGLQGVAGTAADGGVYLVNTATAGAHDLRIERVQNFAAQDLDQSGVNSTSQIGVRALDGNIEVTQQGGRVVLGKLRDVAAFTDPHLDASGNIAVNAAGGIEIENARFLRVLVPVIDDETGEQEENEDGTAKFEADYLRLNDARIRSTSGDVLLNGTVNTSASSVASTDSLDLPDELDTDHDAPTGSEFIHGSLRSEAGGTTRFRGDVGMRGDSSAPLEQLDTTRASVEGGGIRNFLAGDLRFRGRLDGTAASDPVGTTGANLVAQDLSTSATDHQATVTIDGDVGTALPLANLTVNAERIRFTATDEVIAHGDILLTTNQNPTSVPQVATISDELGGVRFATPGNFSTGDVDKLSVAGGLEIEAQNVRVTDLSATRISIDSPNIVIVARQPGQVELRNGSTVPDNGTDIVANQINLASIPTVVPASGGSSFPTPTFGLGTGGIVAPGSLSGFNVVRFTQDVEGVERELFFGEDGVILDLTASGSTLIGNPSKDIPRERAVTQPSLPPRFSDEAPAAPPPVDTAQVLAFLRCGAPGSLTSCDGPALAPLDTLEDFADSPLATPRAAELAERYRALRSTDLSAAFDAAGAGFRQQSGFGEFDPVAFGSYLEASPQHAPARNAIRELAIVLVEVDLLGLPSDVETQLRTDIASDLANEADLPGFDTEAVFAAVAATPIGLPPETHQKF